MRKCLLRTYFVKCHFIKEWYHYIKYVRSIILLYSKYHQFPYYEKAVGMGLLYSYISLIPRPSHLPVFDHLQYAKREWDYSYIIPTSFVCIGHPYSFSFPFLLLLLFLLVSYKMNQTYLLPPAGCWACTVIGSYPGITTDTATQ